MNQFISLERIRFQKSQSEFLFSPQHTFICSEHRHHHGSSQYLRIESYSGTRMLLFFSWRVDWRQVMTSLKSVRDGYDDMVAIETVTLPALKCSRIIEWNIAILTHMCPWQQISNWRKSGNQCGLTGLESNCHLSHLGGKGKQ